MENGWNQITIGRIRKTHLGRNKIRTTTKREKSQVEIKKKKKKIGKWNKDQKSNRYVAGLDGSVGV